MYLRRQDIFEKAIHDCYVELYEKAQPMADYDNLVAELKAGKIDEKKDGPVYERHYISKEELDYVLNKYIEAYGMTERWKGDIETLENYLNNGGTKKQGKEYEDVAPLTEHIHEILIQVLAGLDLEATIEKVTAKVMELIKNCKDFYKFDCEAERFRAAIYLGAAPSISKDTVKDWWKEHYNTDIEIEDRNPKLFWYRDNEYTDEDLAEEYGTDNWKEIVDKEWEDEKAKIKQQHDEALKEINDILMSYQKNK